MTEGAATAADTSTRSTHTGMCPTTELNPPSSRTPGSGTFPERYDNTILSGDYNRQDIEAVTFDPTYQTETSDNVFDTNAGAIADLTRGSRRKSVLPERLRRRGLGDLGRGLNPSVHRPRRQTQWRYWHRSPCSSRRQEPAIPTARP